MRWLLTDIDRSGTQGTRCHITHWRNGFRGIKTLGSWSAGDLQEWGMNADTLKKAWNNDANNLKELLKSETVEPVDAEPQIGPRRKNFMRSGRQHGAIVEMGETSAIDWRCTVRENVEMLMGGRGRARGICHSLTVEYP